MSNTIRHAGVCGAMLAILLLTACAGAPSRKPDDSRQSTTQTALGESITASALAQVGRPYRYGGDGPDAFDCSGLVRFAHAAHGLQVPRTTDEQYRSARPVSLQRIAAGDLLFFRFDGQRKVSHVAIYAGNGRFVHAPDTGRAVEVRALDDWYRRRLVGAGRLHP